MWKLNLRIFLFITTGNCRLTGAINEMDMLVETSISEWGQQELETIVACVKEYLTTQVVFCLS